MALGIADFDLDLGGHGGSSEWDRPLERACCFWIKRARLAQPAS
jgi:hypothetical protein